MNIGESGENYLEAILVLKKRNGAVRSIDIANEMGFSKPSVSVAMKNFRENGYITMEDGFIELTDLGRDVAEKILNRHETLTRLLMAIGVDETEAAETACRIEHDLSDNVISKIKEYMKKAGM